MKSLLLKSASSLIISVAMIGGIKPALAQMNLEEMPVLHMGPPAMQVAKPVIPSATLQKNPFTYTFRGQAVSEGQPCAHITVIVEVTAGQSRQMKRVTTDAQGRYSASVTLMGVRNDSVYWQIAAHTRDLKSAEIDGRNIMLSDSNINVTQTLDLVSD